MIRFRAWRDLLFPAPGYKPAIGGLSDRSAAATASSNSRRPSSDVLAGANTENIRPLYFRGRVFFFTMTDKIQRGERPWSTELFSSSTSTKVRCGRPSAFSRTAPTKSIAHSSRPRNPSSTLLPTVFHWRVASPDFSAVLAWPGSLCLKAGLRLPLSSRLSFGAMSFSTGSSWPVLLSRRGWTFVMARAQQFRFSIALMLAFAAYFGTRGLDRDL